MALLNALEKHGNGAILAVAIRMESEL